MNNIDKFFIQLTMDINNKDDDLYQKWALWCAKSNGKYTISVKDGTKFYTVIKTNEEIELDNLRTEYNTFLCIQNCEHKITKKYQEYQHWFIENILDDEKILQFTPLTFEEWKEK